MNNLIISTFKIKQIMFSFFRNTKPKQNLEQNNNEVDFNDDDAVINYETNKSPLTIKTQVVETVSAPKTPERLEKISYERNEQRKIEEAEEDDDSDEEDRIKIHSSADLKLDTLDIHNLDKSLKLEKPLLTDIEVLK